MKPIKQVAFCGLNTGLKPPHLMVWSVKGTAARVRAEIGNSWYEKDERGSGWKSAHRDGIRVVKVEIKTLAK